MADTVAETERLRLREWDTKDAEAFYRRMNLPEVMKHLGGVQDFATWNAGVERILGYQRDFGHTLWIVEDKESGALLGFCGIKRFNTEGGAMTGEHEVGWRFHPGSWGKGIAKEAAIAALDLAFGRFGAPHVVALTISANRASWGLMERLGMTRRPDLDFTDPRFGPELNPTIIYRINAEDWPAARARALAPRPA